VAFAFERPGDRAHFSGPGKKGIGQPLRHLPKVDELTALLALDQSGILEDAQMVGQRRLAELEAVANFARGELAGAQIRKDLPTSSGGKGFEDAFHVP